MILREIFVKKLYNVKDQKFNSKNHTHGTIGVHYLTHSLLEKFVK